MRKLLLAGAAGAALFTTGLAAPSVANAMPLAPLASSGSSVVDNVTYWYRPGWRCGPYGCGWNRFYGWRPGPYYGYYGYGRPYWGYRPWAYRWGYRHYW